MSKVNDEIEYCMSCGNLNPLDREICDCGGRKFVFGKNFKLEKGVTICNCGSDKFIFALHLNLGSIHEIKYKCSNCSNIIGIQSYVGGTD